jgi:predicted Zn-dependent protease with MMP-like domain
MSGTGRFSSDVTVGDGRILGRVNITEFEKVVDEALAELPEWVRDVVDNLHVVVVEWPSPDQEAVAEGRSLLGLYEGVSLLDRGSHYTGVLPDRISIFMGPHLAMRLTPARLRKQIRRTVLHEVAHHLGIDDERLHDLGWG